MLLLVYCTCRADFDVNVRAGQLKRGQAPLHLAAENPSDQHLQCLDILLGKLDTLMMYRGLIGGDVVAYWWRCGASLLEMWWLIVGDVEAHCWRCGGSLLEMWWLIVGDVVDHCWEWGGSLLEI